MSQSISRQQRRFLERESRKAEDKPKSRRPYLSALEYYEGKGRLVFMESEADLAEAAYVARSDDDNAPLTLWAHSRTDQPDFTLHAHNIDANATIDQ
ncbi:hypothetical protein [Agrobacterium tumefaciens]|uniref:hypothetical protein n=1 Tax=Agrobacterium tumefaciens TaxID=358 RepID=UPI0015722077|nr:hypothetical protein [Agrobacterium tumefaciens]